MMRRRSISPARMLGVGLLIAVCAALPAEARQVRIATYNVEHGIGPVGSEKYEAQKAVLARVNADIIAFQELETRTSNEWDQLAAELGYPYRVWGERGPFSGNMYVGYYSRYPILNIHTIQSPDEAAEFSRYPLRAVIDVPGAAQPLVIWNMHHKAMFGYKDCFRRAVEARRIAEDIQNYVADHPDHAEYVLVGDMNDDPARPNQPRSFGSVPKHLPKSYALGDDIDLPIRYQSFPTDIYSTVGDGMYHVLAYRQGSENNVTHLHTNYQLDYVFVSDALHNSPDGQPMGEIYHSEWDKKTGGLSKSGDTLHPSVSLKATDHYVVFVDVNMADAAR